MKKNKGKHILWLSVGCLWAAALASTILMLTYQDLSAVTLKQRMAVAGFIIKSPVSFSDLLAAPEYETHWVFYDKKAFIRHFKDDYNLSELMAAYDKATSMQKRPVRVEQRTALQNSVNKFDSRFSIKPVPVTQ